MLKSRIRQLLQNKNIIGIGTGRTVSSILRYLDPFKTYVSSSYQTTLSLISYNFKVVPIETVDRIDLYIDGCDYFDAEGNMIKGKGGSLTTEKLLCAMANMVLIVVQDHKFRKILDDCYVPIEVIPSSVKYFSRVMVDHQIDYSLRSSTKKYGPVVTDLGNFIFDIKMDREFLAKCRSISGVIEHGYFSSKDYKLNLEVIREE
jgi:ribose 5-phosphate isomerase A